MGTARKPRSDSPLKLLSEERQEQIIAWCLAPKTEDSPGGYQHAREQLAADGIKVSIRALSDFYSWFQTKGFFEAAEDHAEQQRALMAEFDPADTERAEAFADFCFIQKTSKNQDLKGYVAVGQLRQSRKMHEAKVAHDTRSLAIQERRVAVLEANARDAAREVAKLRDPKGELTDTERAAIVAKVDSILGIK